MDINKMHNRHSFNKRSSSDTSKARSISLKLKTSPDEFSAKMKNPINSDQKIKGLGLILLRCGTMMQSNGASTTRIRNSIDRIAREFRIRADLFITHQAVTITLSDANNKHIFSAVRRTSPPGVNFKIVSGISRMSRKLAGQNWTLRQINIELNRLASLPYYPRFMTLSLVGLAGSGFCGIIDGTPAAMIVAFIATVCGLFVRQEAKKKRFNPYLCVFFAALSATLFSGILIKLFPDKGLENALATSVLFLIPGVPLINSFTDLLDGNILNGILRAVNGLLISFMIALGFLSSLFICQI
ncbi:MAG: threonine/serine exporter family protein [Desulfobacteraceae bacterium]